jgi:SagB-type dehydrogenase family enzyme
MTQAWDEIVSGGPEEERVWELFHENSKTHRLSDAPDDAHTAAVMRDLWEDLPYAGADAVRLPGLALPPTPIGDAILERRTATTFGNAPISLQDLASLLTGGYGATERASVVGNRRFRTVPSAGALYPLELYVFVRAVTGIEPGLYHFQATAGLLQRLRLLPDEELASAFVQSDVINSAAAVILITAVFQRTTFKYGERGYRFILIEAGHVAQNIDLIASALHLPAANVGGFFDRELETLLDIDGVEQSLVYAVAIGSNTSSAFRPTSTSSSPSKARPNSSSSRA